MKRISKKSERPTFSRSESKDFAVGLENSNPEVEDIPPEAAKALGRLAESLGPTRTRRTEQSSEGTPSGKSIFWSEPLIAYKYDPGLARREEILLTIKTTLQLEKNDQQAEIMKMPGPKVFGRAVSRPHVRGLVACFPLAYDRFSWTLAESKWAFSAVEPYGIDASTNKIALATADSVRLIDVGTGQAKYCKHPWMSQAHTVHFSGDGKKLLVGSAGFDAVFEFDTATAEVVWQWFAWDHGFDRSKLGHYVVRSAERRGELAALGHEVLLLDDPTKYEFGIPTRQKPAHLNSACYDSDGGVLVTLFHQGAGYVVNRDTGEAQEVISGLLVPHKLSRRKRGGYFISDTRRGRLILLDENFHHHYEVTLSGMPGVERSAQLPEFLQNATELRENLFGCIDIHRNSLWLIDVSRRTYRGIKFPMEWSVHDIVTVGRRHGANIGRLVGTQFGKVAAFSRQLNAIHHFSVDGREIAALALDKRVRHTRLDG